MLAHFFSSFSRSICIYRYIRTMFALPHREIDGNRAERYRADKTEVKFKISKTKAWAQQRANERMNERANAKNKRIKYNKVSSPFGCNRCCCTAIYLLWVACIAWFLSFTSCISVLPSYRHLSRRASIFYFFFLHRICGYCCCDFFFVSVLTLLVFVCVFAWIASISTFSNGTSKFHYERVIGLMESKSDMYPHRTQISMAKTIQ